MTPDKESNAAENFSVNSTRHFKDATSTATSSRVKCIYLPPTYIYFIQDIEDRCLLLMSSTSFVNLLFHEHRMTEKHHMDQNPCMSSLHLK
jgi:hypothetical protein